MTVVDRDALARVITRPLVNVMNLPEWMQSSALGRDMRPIADLIADAVLEHLRCTDLTKYPKGWLRCHLPAGHDGLHALDFDNPGAPPTPATDGLRERIEALCDEADSWWGTSDYDGKVRADALRYALEATR